MDKTKFLLSLALIFATLGLLFIFQSQNSAKTRLIFCDVGQGDGILVMVGTKQVLIDGGPGTKIVDCLGQTMPFWDRTIEMVVLTHPQRDHLEGLIEVLARYDVGMIVTTEVPSNTELFGEWEKSVANAQAKIYVPDAGDQLVIDRGLTPLGVKPLSLQVLWPQRDQIAIWKQSPPQDLNETSIVMRLTYGGFCAYLTADIPKEILQPLIDTFCQVLKVAHHGSRTGTNQEIVDLVKPAIAIIQVGKNSFGHPHKEVIDLLVSGGVKVFRNDINGIIEIESDGERVRVEAKRGK